MISYLSRNSLRGTSSLIVTLYEVSTSSVSIQVTPPIIIPSKTPTIRPVIKNKGK